MKRGISTKIHPQIILKKGTPAFVVLPYKEYEAILASIEDAEDIEAITIAQADQSEGFPLDMVERIAAGENAIKIFREYREISQKELADRANVSRQYISQIEGNERTGTMKVRKKIAVILSVDLDDIA